MVISSLVVDATFGEEQRIAEMISARDGAEVHGIEGNRIVVTIEAETISDSHALASSFIEIEGVININLIYANFEDDPSLKKVAN